MDRLDAIQAFVAIAESGSFSGAAGRLKLPRALLSKRIAALERELGVQLLNRTTRRVSLTSPGLEFLSRSQRLLADYEEAVGAIASLQAEPAGRLKVSVGVSFGTRHLAPMLAGFMTQHPKVLVELTLDDRFIDPVEEGFDLCVRIGRLSDSSLIVRRLATARRVLCASPAYLERRGVPASPQELERHAGLHYSQHSHGRRWLLVEPDGHSSSVEVPCALASNNGDVLLEAALAGHGVASLPTFIVGDALRVGELALVLPSWVQPTLDVAALWPPTRYLPGKMRAFIDFLAQRITDPPPWEQGIGIAEQEALI